MRRERGGNGKNGSKWIRPEKRLAIYFRDGFACVYCRKQYAIVGELALTLDHVIPRSRGGSNDATNLVTSRLCCNARRQAGDVIDRHHVSYFTRKPIDIAAGKQLLAARRKLYRRLDVSDVSDTNLGLAPK